MFKHKYIATIIALILIIVIAMAQTTFNYENSWKKVEAAINNGKPKTAIEEIDKIYEQAKKEKNEAHLVKAIVYKAHAVGMVEEDNWQKNIAFFEKEIMGASEPVKQILYSITAGLYQSYFENQRWKIYNRTQTNNADPNDPATWSVEDFNNRIAAYFEKSIANPAQLQKTGLDTYGPILNKGNTRHLRPTLYDLLAHEALQYFQNEESEITKPVYSFVPDYAALAPFKIFIRQQYESRDSQSHSFKAIRIYQDLLRFHQNDTNPDALIDLDIARLKFAYEEAELPGKGQLYKEALEHIYTQYPKNPQAMQAGYRLANWWYEKGENYQPATGIAEDKMAFAIALEYAEKVHKAFPKSEGGIQAANLIAKIKKPLVTAQVEKVNVANKPFRALLTFKNLGVVYFRLVKLPASFNQEKEVYEDENGYWARVTGMSPVKSWKQVVPTQLDYRSHSAEIKIDGLPNGRYLLLASGDEYFSLGENPLSSAITHVSNLSFVNSGQDYFVLNRENGKPIAAAKVQVWYSRYDYYQRRTLLTKGGIFVADNNGHVQITTQNDGNTYYGNMRLEISAHDDYLFLEDGMHRPFLSNQRNDRTIEIFESDQAQYYFFTDRAIYRPGQKLYFKAIGLTTDAQTGNPKLYKPSIVEVTLRNANYEKLSSLNFSPNQFASINGNFLLPLSGLTGVFQLEIKCGERTWNKTIRVEEYKRPKFFVEYKPIEGAYKLNNEITVEGLAKGYAGNNIDGAQVTYRVTRATRFLYPYFGNGRGGYWPPIFDGVETEITNGATTTKADGSFAITFTALPDLSVNANLDPSFDFNIEAVVTDINGEVRSGETTISVGYKSLLLSLGTGGPLMRPADSAIKLSVATTNLNGKPQARDVKLKLVALGQPVRLLRKRTWEAPDTSVYTRGEFEKWFPNDPFGNEDDFRNWEDRKTILSTILKTPDAGEYTIKAGSLSPGYYRVEASSEDLDGKEVRTVEFISIFDAVKGQLPAPDYLMGYQAKNTFEPGQDAIFWQGTSLSDAFIIQQTIKKNNRPLQPEKEEQNSFEFIKPGKGFERYNFSTTEQDRGGYLVNRIMVYQNRVYTQSWQVNVPWTNKDLKISFETFRDKLEPGDSETWTVKISGARGEQVAAEMLASMYDASLDQFVPNTWDRINPWLNNSFYNQWESRANFGVGSQRSKTWYSQQQGFDKRYDQLISIAGIYNYRMYMVGDRASGGVGMPPPMAKMMDLAESNENMQVAGQNTEMATVAKPGPGGKTESPNPEKDNLPGNMPTRKNFNETALFFPNLHTDEQGNISFSFTMPEALTQWKLQLLGHTTDARFAYASKDIVTQKQLMVIPNAPRYFRQGDQMEFSVKISNLGQAEMTGQAQLQLLNATTMQPVDGWFKNVIPSQYFTVGAGQSTALKFPIEIPFQFQDAVVYRVVAKAGETGDGEEMALPVLTNRMLVTESFPLNLRGGSNKSFTWQRFIDLSKDAQKSGTLDHQSITVEYTTNPAWYAVQSLPYIMEYPYDCAEQTWNRFYANALAGKIANSSPRIKAIFESWKQVTPDVLLSNLQKNQELKSALLEETPWVMQAKNETEQKKNLGLLFDLVRMDNEAESAMRKLVELQGPNGGFVWFKGGHDDRYMTQYILTGIGHLRKLNAWPIRQQEALGDIISRALPYADARIYEEYQRLLQSKADLKALVPSSFVLQYLYMRSFFPETPANDNVQRAVAYYTAQAKALWTKLGKYEQGMVALSLHRGADKVTPKAILESLTQFSIRNEEFGMYWKELNNPGWYWLHAPIESHALLMEAYNEIEGNVQRVDDLKTWLLKQKQTTNWKTTKATAEACYALLMQGTDWLSVEKNVSIDLGSYKINSAGRDDTEAGTGYFKQVIAKEKIQPEMGNIKVKVELPNKDNTAANSTTSWGAVYWQYFEDLDKVSTAGSPVAIKKELYVLRNTDRGPVLELLKEGAALKVGDRVKVRVEIKSDRNLEYVHMKDMRAACFEPLNVLSGYRMQGGLGYYEATRDASSNFFIGYLPRGKFVFEYELRATLTGNFSNGITTLQCMYAPEFSSHSGGIRVTVE